MKCEICGQGVEGVRYHDENLHRIAERVAKLEAERDLAAAETASSADKAGAMSVGSGKNVATPAAAVTSPAIPDGFALAPGWDVVTWAKRPGRRWPRCTCLDHQEKDDRHDGVYLRDADGFVACDERAVEMGALVPLVHAEPSGTRGEACNGRCGYSECREDLSHAANRTAPAPQPEAPAGFKVHRLKTWPEFFDDVVSGRKTFEIRKNDRDFKVGDEWIPEEFDEVHGYTGRRCSPLTITYVTPPSRCLPDGVVGFSFEKSRRVEKPLPAERPGCGGGRADCFCAARKEGTAWCARCANAWCSQDEDDPNAECRVGPPDARPTPEVAKGCGGPAGQGSYCGFTSRGGKGLTLLCHACWDKSHAKTPPAPSEPAKARGIEYAQPITQPACSCASCRVCCPQPSMRSEPAKAPLSEPWRSVVEHLWKWNRFTLADAMMAKVADLARALELSEATSEEFERLYNGSEQAATTANTALTFYKAKLAAAEQDRAFMEAHDKEGWDLANKRTLQWKDDEKAADARVAEERARCLAHFERFWEERRLPASSEHMTYDDLGRAIASGTPAPAVVKP